MAPSPPVPVRPRVWWHGIGVFVIVSMFFAFIDFGMTGRLTWSPVAVLGVAFLAGGIMVLQVLAAPNRTDKRPFLAGAALLVVAILLLPVTLALQSTETTTQSLPSVPFSSAVRRVQISVANDVGLIRITFEETETTLVRAEVVHVGGLFSAHYDGDVSATNATAGDTLTYSVTARGLGGLFFAGGHEVTVAVNRNLSTALTLTSTTGNILVDVSAGVTIRSIEATVATGGISVVGQDPSFVDGATIRATSTTGNLVLDLKEPAGGPGTVAAFLTTTTGQVSFAFARTPTAAARVQSQTTTGSIDWDAGRYTGTGALLFAPDESTYEVADLKFNVLLQATTGNILVG